MPILKRFFAIVLVLGLLLLLGCLFLKRYDYLMSISLKQYRYFKNAPPADAAGLPIMDQNEFLNLGWLEAEKTSSFLGRLLPKAPGVVRIGIFGGSMTTCGGSAGGKNFDYPALLQEKFKEAGFDSVEVINFGASAYGLAQCYMRWKALGPAQDLDYLIFAAHDLPKVRDLTFKMPGRPAHARFILEHGRPVLVPVVGSTRDEACKIYDRLFPPLRYLRYDITMPFLLKIFLPESLHARVNPFYYQLPGQRSGELVALYAALFKEIALQAKSVIVLVPEDEVGNFRLAVKNPNVHFFAPKARKSLKTFLYLRNQHPNVLGNELVAQELFSFLTGKDSWGSSALKLTPCLGLLKDRASPFTLPLSGYKALSFWVDQRPVAEFFQGSWWGGALKGLPKKFFPQKNSVKSFLVLTDRDASEVKLLPLPFVLKNNEPVFLLLETKGIVRKILWGTVRAPSDILGTIDPGQNGFNMDIQGKYLVIKNPETVQEIKKGADRMRVMIADKEIMKVRLAKSRPLVSFRKNTRKSPPLQERLHLSLAGVTFKMGYLQLDEKYFLAGDPFDKETGTLDLVLEKREGGVERCPLFSYQRVPFQKPIPDAYKEFKA